MRHGTTNDYRYNLADGSKAEVPTGLVRGRQELVPSGEPLIYRNFIAGAGPRAIGVGYPEKANLAFDAATMRSQTSARIFMSACRA